MKLDGEKFFKAFDKMADIGKTKAGGCERLSMSDEDILARKALISMLADEDMSPEEDEIGVIWARIDGEDNEAAPVLVGSHIDTVRNGGKYDGLLGVMMGFQAMRQIKESGVKHRRPIELIVFPNEESARFNYPTVGSKLIAGKIEPQKLKEMKDRDGISFFEALVSRGFSPENCEKSRERLKRAFSMTELHIEQGPVLESKGLSVGVVSAIAAPTRLSVAIKGEYAHSGACPMNLRRDALAAAAEFILAVEKAGKAREKDRTVAAATLCSLENPSMNVVPGSVSLCVDIRGINAESIESCVAEVREQLSAICVRRSVTGEITVISSEKPVAMSERMIEAVCEACRKNNVEYEVMPSGAGHDAMNVAAVLPVGMIFVPCKGGISHNPAEAVERRDIEVGFEVLLDLLVEEANHD